MRFRASLVLGSVAFGIYLLSVAGWTMCLKRQPWAMLVLLGIGGYMTIVSCAGVDSRMRHPIMPALCLLGGPVLAWVVSRTKAGRSHGFEIPVRQEASSSSLPLRGPRFAALPNPQPRDNDAVPADSLANQA